MCMDIIWGGERAAQLRKAINKPICSWLVAVWFVDNSHKRARATRKQKKSKEPKKIKEAALDALS